LLLSRDLPSSVASLHCHS